MLLDVLLREERRNVRGSSSRALSKRTLYFEQTDFEKLSDIQQHSHSVSL
jgi:hypothetical protein